MGCGASSPAAAMSPSASHPSQAQAHSQARFHVIAGGSGGGGDVPLLGFQPLTGSSLALTGLSSALNNLDFAETSSTATNVEDFLAPTVPQKNDVPSTTKSQQGTLDKDDDARTNDTATASASASASASATQQEDSSFPRLSVRLAWLRRFVDSCKGKKYTWTARDFLKAEHGGGSDDNVQVTTDNLQEHRTRMNAAGKDGDGKPTNVQYVDIPFELMTTNDVCFGIVKPATEHAKTSYADMLLNTEPAEVQNATVFVSHAWKYTFMNVVDALGEVSENAYVWFDVFTVNQHASLQVPPDWWFTTFKEAVASIGHTVLILMPWDDPIPLTRAWCIWEILSTIDGQAKFEICLPAVEQKAFAEFLVNEGASKVIVKMVRMDVQRAEAWNVTDRDAILDAVRAYPGGPSEVNKIIKDQMRSWVEESAISALNSLDKEKRAISELLMDVAELVVQRGKYAEAEPLYREALDGRRRELGDAHPGTLDAINNFAILLKTQHKYAEAEPLYREALDGRRRNFGDAHPDTLDTINNLANFLMNQGKLEEAEPLYREALDGRRRELGDTHSDTLGSINNLALMLTDQRKYAEAEPLHREALDARRRELGDSHPDTLASINNLAISLKQQGKYAEAEPLYIEALDGRRRELGDTHPSTLASINNLATVLKSQGKFAEAEPLYLKALDGFRRELGDGHPQYGDSCYNFANMLKIQSKNNEAASYYDLAVRAYEQCYGTDHKETVDAATKADECRRA
ncbi:kinesin light chain [Pycnococcus provasolii]